MLANKTVNIENVAGNVHIGDSPEYQVNSAINELLLGLAQQPFVFQQIRRRPPASALAKIQFNQLQGRQYIIKQYMDYSAAIEVAYKGIDSVIPFGEQIVLRNLNDLYFAALDACEIEYMCGEVDVILVRENSTFIVDFIIAKLRNYAFESKNSLGVKEMIDQGINVIVAHAFIECIIFENPENVT